MAISTGIPANQLVPLYWVTVDGSMAGNLVQNDPAPACRNLAEQAPRLR